MAYDFQFQVQTRIQRPVAEVFAAVHDPRKLSVYFADGGASGPLEPGKTVTWRFHGFEGDVPVWVKEVVANQRIVFEWDASEGDFDPASGQLPPPSGYKTRVEMTFERLGPDETLVRIREGRWRETPAGLKGSYLNCQGWTEMLLCLKAYVQHGLNLRQGAY